MMPHMLDDPDLKEFDYRMSKTITLMPEEVQDRFKALKCLYVIYLIPLTPTFRMLNAKQMRKRRHFTVPLNSNTMRSIRKCTWNVMRFSRVPRPHSRISLRSMRPARRSSMMRTIRSSSRYRVMSRRFRTAPSASRASGCERCLIMAGFPV